MEFSTYFVQLNDAILLESGPNLAYLKQVHMKKTSLRNPETQRSMMGYALQLLIYLRH